MGNISNVLGFPFVPPVPRTPEEQMRESMLLHEFCPPSPIILDGNIHRFAVENSKDAGWYVGFSDSYGAGGSYGNWKTGETVKWSNVNADELSLDQRVAHDRHMAEILHLRESERKRRQETAADTVQSIWERAGRASPDHSYLKRKQVPPHSLRITGDGRLMVPIYHARGELVNLQYINDDGEKRFHKGAEIKGCFYVVGTIANAPTVYIAEGYATAASVHAVTEAPVVVAFNAGNLESVAQAIRKETDAPMVIVADNDESGTGQKYANLAASSVGARVVIPPILGMDMNDFVLSGGDAHALFNPAKPWLIWAEEFCSFPQPIRWRVKHWIQDDAMIMVHGPSGCGKTFLVLDWCLHIASGLPQWANHKVNAGTVIYLAGEGHHGLRSRVAAWKQHHRPDHMDMAISSSGTDLNTVEGLHKTVSSIREIGANPSLIVVDTLHRFLAGDENSAQDTKTMLDACALLMKEFSCSVLLVHHTGVSAEAQHRARGSSAWKGALDIEVSVEKKEKSDTMKVIQRKNKDAELTEDIYLTLTPVPINGWFDEDGEQVTSVVLVPTDAPPPKIDRQESKDVGVLREAWEHAGRETTADGVPYVSQSGFRDYLTSTGKSEGAAVQALKVSGNGLVRRLIESGIITEYKYGFAIRDEGLSSVLLLS